MVINLEEDLVVEEGAIEVAAVETEEEEEAEKVEPETILKTKKLVMILLMKKFSNFNLPN